MISNPRYDIIEKQIAELAKVFATLLGLPTESALREIREFYQSWLGLDKEALMAYSPEELLPFLIHEKDFTSPALELLAELFAKEGEILFQNQQFSVAKDHLQKALVIFGYVEEHSETFSFQRRNTIAKTNSLFKDISTNHDL